MLSKELNLAIEAAQVAGREILNFYKKENEVEEKSDGSPITLADKASHESIIKILKKSGLPIVSEEDREHDQPNSTYWLVDPLDGTKDYLDKNDEFTVNIALIKDQYPNLGIIFAPALNEMFIGIEQKKTWHLKNDKKVLCSSKPRNKGIVVTTSRFHDHEDVEIFIKENNIVQKISAGSALKFGKVSLCEADVYPRVVGSSEWDTAAGQAVVEGVGGHVLNWNTGKRLSYGSSNRRNPRFICIRAPYGYAEFKLKHYEDELK